MPLFHSEHRTLLARYSQCIACEQLLATCAPFGIYTCATLGRSEYRTRAYCPGLANLTAVRVAKPGGDPPKPRHLPGCPSGAEEPEAEVKLAHDPSSFVKLHNSRGFICRCNTARHHSRR